MTFGRAAASIRALAALLVSVGPSPARAAPVRGEAVSRFRVQSASEGDGGRFVRLSRRSAGWRFEYRLSFWHGNGGVVVGGLFRRGRCRSGDADGLQEPVAAMSRASLDDRLAGYLRECPLPPAQEAALRRGLDAAWPDFSARVGEAWATTQAEAEAIANYGEEP
jgi:hypothetical protein